MSSEATVFIVEDDPLLSKQLREDCEGLGFWVIGHAADSESALDKIIR